jgi:hypothetical protein
MPAGGIADTELALTAGAMAAVLSAMALPISGTLAITMIATTKKNENLFNLPLYFIGIFVVHRDE